MPRKETHTDIDDWWQDAFDQVGLKRPTDQLELFVFRVVLSVTSDTVCSKSVTSACPNSEPEEVIANLLVPWPNLLETQAAGTWRLTMVHSSRKQAKEPALCQPTYIITLPATPSLRRRPHCLVEVVWGHCSWFTAIAMPRWVNMYSCHALLYCICGPVLEGECKAFLNEALMTTELVECHTGSFFHINITWQVSDFIVDDSKHADLPSALILFSLRKISDPVG